MTRAPRIASRATLVAAGLTLLAALPIASADHAAPGALVRLRSGPASSMAMELGGPRRDGRLARGLLGARHRVIERVALPTRRSTPPVEWTEDRIVVGTANGLLVRSPDGALQTAALGPVDVRPAVLPSGELLVATRDGRLIVLTLELEARAERRLESFVRTSPLLLDDGSLVVVASDHTLLRLDSDLSLLFATKLPRLVSALPEPPALATDAEGLARIVIADGERLHVLDLFGTLLSSIDLGERAASAPLVDERGDVRLLTQSGTLLDVTAARRVRRRTSLEGRIVDPSATLARASDGSVRVAIPTRGVLAIGADGSERWVASTDAPFHGPLGVLPDDETLAFDRRGRLVVIAPDGTIRERVELGGVASGSPMIARDGTLWATTDAPELVQVGPEARPEPASSD